MKTEEQIKGRREFLVSCLRNEGLFNKTEQAGIQKKISEYNWILGIDHCELAINEVTQ